MNVSISVDFGQGYRVALIPADARKLYDQLKPLFETEPSIALSTTGSLWSEAGLTTTNVMPVSNYFTAKVSEETVDKMAAELEAKVKAEMDKQGLGSEECKAASYPFGNLEPDEATKEIIKNLCSGNTDVA